MSQTPEEYLAWLNGQLLDTRHQQRAIRSLAEIKWLPLSESDRVQLDILSERERHLGRMIERAADAVVAQRAKAERAANDAALEERRQDRAERRRVRRQAPTAECSVKWGYPGHISDLPAPVVEDEPADRTPPVLHSTCARQGDVLVQWNYRCLGIRKPSRRYEGFSARSR